MKSIYPTIYLFLFSVLKGFAQDPISVDINQNDSLPPAFALGSNYYSFQSKAPIQSCTIVSDSVNWNIKHIDSTTYLLGGTFHSRSKRVELAPSLTLRFICSNQDTLYRKVPIIAYAPVKVIPSFKGHYSNDTIYLPYEENQAIMFKAEWEYPDYVGRRLRLYGHFSVTEYYKNEPIYRMSGWYDTGDKTKFIPILNPNDLENIYFEVTQLSTLHKLVIPGMYPVTLSENFPTKWYVKRAQ